MNDKGSLMQQLSRLRIGHGYDVHRFGEGDHIMLGGVRLAFEHGFIAHSDGDVLIHALCDALLGSIAVGDIGRHFPDNDKQFENIASSELLRETCNILGKNSASIINIDVTVVAQRPRLAAHIDEMRQHLSGVTDVPVDNINIKATTTEGLGFEGRSEGIAVHCVVLVCKDC